MGGISEEPYGRAIGYKKAISGRQSGYWRLKLA